MTDVTSNAVRTSAGARWQSGSDRPTLRQRVRTLLATKAWERTIMGLIIFNAFTLGLETSDTMMERFGEVLLAIDRIVLAVFVLEIALRLYAHGLRFFRDPWSLFDFTIVAIALVPSSGPFQVLRALRILRVLRLISVVPSLRRVVNGFVKALPGMGSVLLLMMIVFYVGSVIATKLFGDAFPEWFGSLGASAYTLFQVMTLESWSMGIVRPVMEEFPYAWAFFVPFILSTTFVVLNLFLGVVVSALQSEVEGVAEDAGTKVKAEADVVTKSIDDLRREVAALREDLANRS